MAHEIAKINCMLHEMISDDKYTIVRFALRSMLAMDKGMIKGIEDLYLDIDKKMLMVPEYMVVLPHEAIKWMLLHEAAHLTNGDDVTLKKTVELIDHCTKKILDVIHEILETNANIMTIEIYGGIHEKVIENKAGLDTKKLKPIKMYKVYMMLEKLQTLVYKQTMALQAELDQV